MKKIILSAFFAIVTFSAFSQNVGYEKWINIGIGGDIKHDEGNFTFKFTNGYRFNDYIFLGGGMGISLYTYSDELMRIESKTGGYTEINPQPSIAVPVYATFKAYFTAKKIAPFFVVNAGYIFGESDSNSIITSGLFFNPNIGLDFNLNNDLSKSIFVQLGLSIDQNKNMLTWDLEDGARTKVQLNLGFRF